MHQGSVDIMEERGGSTKSLWSRESGWRRDLYSSPLLTRLVCSPRLQQLEDSIGRDNARRLSNFKLHTNMADKGKSEAGGLPELSGSGSESNRAEKGAGVVGVAAGGGGGGGGGGGSGDEERGGESHPAPLPLPSPLLLLDSAPSPPPLSGAPAAASTAVRPIARAGERGGPSEARSPAKGESHRALTPVAGAAASAASAAAQTADCTESQDGNAQRVDRSRDGSGAGARGKIAPPPSPPPRSSEKNRGDTKGRQKERAEQAEKGRAKDKKEHEWNETTHRRFVAAIFDAGTRLAKPKKILNLYVSIRVRSRC